MTTPSAPSPVCSSTLITVRAKVGSRIVGAATSSFPFKLWPAMTALADAHREPGQPAKVDAPVGRRFSGQGEVREPAEQRRHRDPALSPRQARSQAVVHAAAERRVL